eukprot:scaffold5385_cov81-Skeletonema_marinoi.AAC.2
MEHGSLVHPPHSVRSILVLPSGLTFVDTCECVSFRGIILAKVLLAPVWPHFRREIIADIFSNPSNVGPTPSLRYGKKYAKRLERSDTYFNTLGGCGGYKAKLVSLNPTHARLNVFTSYQVSGAHSHLATVNNQVAGTLCAAMDRRGCIPYYDDPFLLAAAYCYVGESIKEPPDCTLQFNKDRVRAAELLQLMGCIELFPSCVSPRMDGLTVLLSGTAIAEPLDALEDQRGNRYLDESEHVHHKQKFGQRGGRRTLNDVNDRPLTGRKFGRRVGHAFGGNDSAASKSSK